MKEIYNVCVQVLSVRLILTSVKLEGLKSHPFFVNVDISAKVWGNSLRVLKDMARIHKKGADTLIFTQFFRCTETQTEVCKES